MKFGLLVAISKPAGGIAGNCSTNLNPGQDTREAIGSTNLNPGNWGYVEDAYEISSLTAGIPEGFRSAKHT